MKDGEDMSDERRIGIMVIDVKTLGVVFGFGMCDGVRSAVIDTDCYGRQRLKMVVQAAELPVVPEGKNLPEVAPVYVGQEVMPKFGAIDHWDVRWPDKDVKQ